MTAIGWLRPARQCLREAIRPCSLAAVSFRRGVSVSAWDLPRSRNRRDLP
jgi:hypothetical protein